MFFKTIVMKICDIYPYLYSYLEMLDYVRLEEDQLSGEIFHYLKRINVEPPKEQATRSSSKTKFRSFQESGRKNEDLGQKVSRNLFNQKTKQTRNEPPESEGSNVVLNGVVRKSEHLDQKMSNEVAKVDARGAFNFLTNGFSDNSKSSRIWKDEESIDRSGSLPGSDSKEAAIKRVAKRTNSRPSAFKVHSSAVDHTADDSSSDKNAKLNDSSLALPSDANDDLTAGSSGTGSGRKSAKQSTNRSELQKKFKKRTREDREIERAEVKTLIEEFKHRESIKKAKRRRLIRESMKFEVE